jgi:predicted lipid-binding transport protein (Tim44 family)
VAARLLPGPQRVAFEDRARSIFTNLQHAWSKRDLLAMRPFETDALWQAHRFWVEEYLRQGLRNVVDDVKISKLELCRVQRDGAHVSVTCRIHASVVDRTINERTMEVVSGNPSRPRRFTEYWTFVKHADAPGGTDLAHCPSCGAAISVSQAGSCEYCQTKVTLGRFDWVASRIEQDEEIVPD